MMNRKIKYMILPMIIAVVLCTLPFLSSADTYNHQFTNLQGLYINNIFYIRDADNTTSDILDISRYISFGEKYASIDDSDYDDAVISYMEDYDATDPELFKVDTIVSLNPILQDINEAIPNGSTDIVFHFETFALIAPNRRTNSGETTKFTHNNLFNWSATHESTSANIGNYSDFGTYTISTYSTWMNRLWHIEFDFSARTGFSFLASTTNWENDSVRMYFYDPVLSVTYVNDFGTGDTSDDIAALDENLRQTIEEQTAAINSAISSQTISINNTISNMEQTIAAGQEDIIDEIAGMYSGISDDLDDIKGYITQTVVMPGGNTSYADYISNQHQDFDEVFDDYKDYEEALNAYIDNAHINGIYDYITTNLVNYVDGLDFWSQVFDSIAFDCAPFVQLLIYLSFTLIILGGVTGIVFVFRKGFSGKDDERFDK